MGIFKATTDNKDTSKKEEKKNNATKEISNDSEGKSMKDLYTMEGKVKKDKDKKVSGRAYRVLIKPMVTEKATNLSAANQYIFMIDNSANKIEVAKAVYEVYGIKPLGVNIIRTKGKKVNRGKISGKRKDFKKAIVTLKKGESISVYEGV